ncbi:trimeric intracellular cation channel type B isoform X1 [Gadus chalcogrammus]|uniref:trimeric intracellular cation channel type B isoform X1 n=2 Tax=Gadus chalcogrammus TaxID=1042646 RepID=UPI0024C488C5|nr:trimeric intracellular cation channel type B isoform X1 [Gadus chalcogrammus]
MDVIGMLNLDEMAHGLAGMTMFPYFDTAHYVVSVMALREQSGVLELSRRSPFACWFSSMLFCFGGAVLSGLMMAEPPIAPLSNSTNVLLASLIWYLVFYCPWDLLYSCAALLPFRLVLSGMKEVTRTWKVLGGVSQASIKYQDSLLVMIAIGWAKGAGGGLIANFEQLVRGVWKPETNELLKMSYPTKITLIGAVMFSLQHTSYLPLQKHHLMLIYTVFNVVNKARIIITGSSTSPFALLESVIYKTLFAGSSSSSSSSSSSPYTALSSDGKKPVAIDNGNTSANKKKPSSSSTPTKESGERRSQALASPTRGKREDQRSAKTKEQEEDSSCKKTD